MLQKTAIRLFLIIPVVSLVLNAIALLRYGIDIPVAGDWRNYALGIQGSFDLKNLFLVANNSMSPTGQFLDGLAFRFLDGNSVAYQFLSLVCVLGALLYLQWKLLDLTIGNKLLAAAAFVFTLLMLQPGSYWGERNFAFHQALPLISLLASLYLVLEEKWVGAWKIGIIFLLGLLAGFSHISGAAAVFVAGLFLLLCRWRYVKDADLRLRNGGWALAASGGLSLVVQGWGTLSVPSASSKAMALAFPHELDFWAFMAGKVSRSVALPGDAMILSFAATVTLILAVFILVVLPMFLTRKFGKLDSKPAKPWIIFAVLVLVAGTYLALVSAGRANLRPAGLNAFDEIYGYGFLQYHFFWVALIWPWFVSIGLIFIRERITSNALLFEWGALGALPLLFVFYAYSNGAFDHGTHYQSAMRSKASGIACLAKEYQKDGPMNCDALSDTSLRQAFLNGLDAGASYGRIIPKLPLDIETGSVQSIQRIGADDWQSATILGVVSSDRTGEGLEISQGSHPVISLVSGKPELMAQCVELETSVATRFERDGSLQLHYRPKGQQAFEQELGRVAPSGPPDAGDGNQVVHFLVRSRSGFDDILKLRSSPGGGNLLLRALEIKCRRTAGDRPSTAPQG